MAILKWLGNKTSLLPTLKSLFNPEATVLVEPFVGSCSLLGVTDFTRYILSDINPDVINLYQWCVKDPGLVIRELGSLYEHHSEKDYYQLRHQFNTQPKDTALAAALFVYLNRWGYRGLCRYNQKGEFNSPYGHYHGAYFPETDIMRLNQRCQETEVVFKCCDWKAALEGLEPVITQVYLDPPYLPISDTANFKDYHTEGFGYEQHLQLSERVVELDSQGVGVVVSNSACEYSSALYGPLRKVVVSVPRSIAGNKQSAKQVEELIAFNTHKTLLD